MKKFAISLIALAAISTASFASNREVTTSYGSVGTIQDSQVVTTDGFAVSNVGQSWSNGQAGDDLGLGGSNRK